MRSGTSTSTDGSSSAAASVERSCARSSRRLSATLTRVRTSPAIVRRRTIPIRNATAIAGTVSAHSQPSTSPAPEPGAARRTTRATDSVTTDTTLTTITGPMIRRSNGGATR